MKNSGMVWKGGGQQRIPKEVGHEKMDLQSTDLSDSGGNDLGAKRKGG
jgi:hypothetical protein